MASQWTIHWVRISPVCNQCICETKELKDINLRFPKGFTKGENVSSVDCIVKQLRSSDSAKMFQLSCQKLWQACSYIDRTACGLNFFGKVFGNICIDITATCTGLWQPFQMLLQQRWRETVETFLVKVADLISTSPRLWSRPHQDLKLDRALIHCLERVRNLQELFRLFAGSKDLKDHKVLLPFQLGCSHSQENATGHNILLLTSKAPPGAPKVHSTPQSSNPVSTDKIDDYGVTYTHRLGLHIDRCVEVAVLITRVFTALWVPWP